MSYLYAKLFWLMHFVCHQRAERSFHWLGVQWFLCARCSGTLIGALLLIPFSLLQKRRETTSVRLLALTTLTLPLIVDGYWGFSNSLNQSVGNGVRFATGMAFSIGAVNLFIAACQLLDKLSRHSNRIKLGVLPE